jgi:hypothetical protein
LEDDLDELDEAELEEDELDDDDREGERCCAGCETAGAGIDFFEAEAAKK